MIKRGDVYMADLSPVIDSEQGGIRAVLILQNDIGNLHSPTTIVAAMTTQQKKNLPTHVVVDVQGLENTILLEQLRTISKTRLLKYMGHLDDVDLERVEQALRVSLKLVDADTQNTPVRNRSFCPSFAVSY